MAGESVAAVTDNTEVRSLAAKLWGLHALLTAAEQRLLHEVLRRAAVDSIGETGNGDRSVWAVSADPFRYLYAAVPEAGSKGRVLGH